jgi:predicted nucleic acid-binding protein
VAVVVDTSVAYAYMNSGDPGHAAVSAWMDETDEELVTTPLVVAELDHLAARFGGVRAARALRADLKAGVYGVEWWPTAMAETVAVAERHGSMEVGLSDASLVALAARLSTTRIATLDERHFRVLTPLTGEGAFTLLPTDR